MTRQSQCRLWINCSVHCADLLYTTTEDTSFTCLKLKVPLQFYASVMFWLRRVNFPFRFQMLNVDCSKWACGKLLLSAIGYTMHKCIYPSLNIVLMCKLGSSASVLMVRQYETICRTQSRYYSHNFKSILPEMKFVLHKWPPGTSNASITFGCIVFNLIASSLQCFL